MRSRSGVIAAVVLVCLACLAPAGAAAASRPQAGPSVRQLITVVAPTQSATYARLTAYRISGGHRVRQFGPWTARVGESGVAPPGDKREGDGRTPSGTFGFSFFFGVLPDPGFAFPFRHAYRYDYWDDDPASARYNEWVDVRRQDAGARPEPMHQVPAYDYAAVITYNASRTPGLGSAIFLHTDTGSATLGCVALPLPELLKILHWLRPGDRPHITIEVRPN